MGWHNFTDSLCRILYIFNTVNTKDIIARLPGYWEAFSHIEINSD